MVARNRLDLLGLLLVLAGISWTLLAVIWSGGSPGPFVALLLSCAFALVVGRLLGSARRWLVPTAVVGAAVVLAARTPDVLSSVPLSAPFRYTNAKGAFFVQAAIAGLMLAAGSRTAPVSFLGLAAAIAFALIPFAAESLTAAALIVLLPFVAWATYVRMGANAAVTVCAVQFIVVLAATIVLGTTYTRGDRSGLLDRVVDSTLTERRTALWHEALGMISEHPVMGVSPGGFQVFSATAQSDHDARWAHNGFLQQGAETGLVGLIILMLLFLWGFAGLRATAYDAVGVLGAVSLAALGIHASVDYILHFPAVPITAAALVGAAGAGRKLRGREES